MAKAKDERKQLEKILGIDSSLDDNVMSDIESGNLEPQPLFDDSFDEIDKECKASAKKLILQAIKHIFTKQMIKDNPYIKDKLEIDIESLSGIIYQNRCSILMQKVLMTEIRMGAASPRHFEVYSNLSKSVSENNKQMLETVEAIKATYQGIINDIREKESYAPSQHLLESIPNTGGTSTHNGVSISSNGCVSSAGSKDIIQMVKNAVNNIKNVDDAEIIG